MDEYIVNECLKHYLSQYPEDEGNVYAQQRGSTVVIFEHGGGVMVEYERDTDEEEQQIRY